MVFVQRLRYFEGMSFQLAWVLGPRAPALAIVERFRALGIEAEVAQAEGEDLDSLELLRRKCEKFAQYGGDSTGFVHPGIGYWANQPEFPAVVAEAGLLAVSPPARALSWFSNKLTLLQEAEKLGIPHRVVRFEPVQSVREIDWLMREEGLTYPFHLREVRGGARGEIVIRSREELEQVFPLWLEQAKNQRGEVLLFAQRYLEGARSLVLPFARFSNGDIHFFPVLDASLQGRHRKLIQFCPPQDRVSPALFDYAKKLADSTGLIGVGAFEYLSDGSNTYLINGLARLHQSFSLWEKIANTNAVAWQLATLDLKQERPFDLTIKEVDQVGISLRLYAEDSQLLLPQPGRIDELLSQREWKFASARAELKLEYEVGDEVPFTGTGDLGTLTVIGPNRKSAVTVARGLLDEVWIAGSVQTNERLISELLSHPWVREGMFHTDFVDSEFVPEFSLPQDQVPLFAALCARELQIKSVAADPTRVWIVGRKIVDSKQVSEMSLSIQNGKITLQDGRSVRFFVKSLSDESPGRWLVRLGAWTQIVKWLSPEEQSQKKIAALVPGRVYSILYRDGAVIPAHHPLLVVESLGRLIPHALPRDVRILKWKVQADQRVLQGQELAEFEIARI